MIIGVLSDTHNHLPECRRALDGLLRRGAAHLVHCGDAGEDALDLISAACLENGIRAHVALGNCDLADQYDARFSPSPAGLEIALQPSFDLAGKRCAALHGHQRGSLAQIVASGQFDYVFTGHTHQPLDEQVGRTRVLNPGSCARPRGGPPTALLLDLESGRAAWIPLGPDSCDSEA